nr:hypothetical protein [Tanacetum cinerariifolium]
MANLLEDIQCVGFDTRPPMLDRTDFASWQQCIRLYCQGKENGVNILKSTDEGPFLMGPVREPLAEGTERAPHLGPKRPRVYSDLSPEEKDRYNDDIMAANILLQRLPNDIYTFINHYTDAKDICDNVKMLLEGSRMQLNSKFMNNMLLEWGRFVIAVKLKRGLRDSNYDQLYAYLKQHETHANENKMMLDRFSQHIVDPLALMSNVSHQQHYSQSSSTPPSIYVPPHLADHTYPDLGISPMDTVGRIEVKGSIHGVKVQLGHIERNCTQPKRSQNSDYYNDKMLLMQAQEIRVALDEEQLLFLKGRQANVIDEDVDEQPVLDLALNVDNVFQADDFPVNDEVGPSYDSDNPSEVHDHDHYQDAACEHHEEHTMHDNVQLKHTVDSHSDYTGDSNIIPYDQPKPYYNELIKVAIGYKNHLCLTRAKQVQPALYNGHEIIKDNHVPTILHNTEDTLEIAEITRRKMNDKITDPECVTHKVKIAPHDYSKENFLATFTPQKQLIPEQIFWS